MSAAALTLVADTGEVVKAVDARALLEAAGITDLDGADTAALAQFTDRATDLRHIATEAQSIVSDELVRRMDRNGRWTLGAPGYQIKAPSPQAGTIAYDTSRLYAALAKLVHDGVITQSASHAALELVEAKALVSYVLLYDVLKALDGQLELADERRVADSVGALLLGEPNGEWRVKPAGINALLKIPVAREAIKACQVPAVPPRRVAKVRRTA